MPTATSAKPRVKKNAIRRERNRGRRSAMRTWIRKTLQAVETGDAEAAQAGLRMATKLIDKNVKWKQLHANTGARKKARLAKAVHQMQAS